MTYVQMVRSAVATGFNESCTQRYCNKLAALLCTIICLCTRAHLVLGRKVDTTGNTVCMQLKIMLPSTTLFSCAVLGCLQAVAIWADLDCVAAGKLFLGGQLAGKQSLSLNPLTLAGWAGLVVNALNTIPLGELDGGRIAFAMWGRRAASRIGVVSTLLLGLTGIVDELALYWVLLVLFLQRGPLVPQQEELSEPSKELTPLAVGLLFLPLLILLPLPFGLNSSPAVGSVF